MCGDKLFKKYPVTVTNEGMIETDTPKEEWEKKDEIDEQQSWVVIDLSKVTCWHPTNMDKESRVLDITQIFMGEIPLILDVSPEQFTQDIIEYTGYYYDPEEE